MKNGKSMIMILGLLAVMFFAYSTFFGSDDETGEVPLEGETAAEPNAGEDLIALLEQLRSIELDGDLFNATAFMALEDQTRVVDPEPVGRNNPFATLGTGGFSQSAGASTAAGTTTAPAGGSVAR